jgi:hypothetical protein
LESKEVVPPFGKAKVPGPAGEDEFADIRYTFVFDLKSNPIMPATWRILTTVAIFQSASGMQEMMVRKCYNVIILTGGDPTKHTPQSFR